MCVSLRLEFIIEISDLRMENKQIRDLNLIIGYISNNRARVMCVVRVSVLMIEKRGGITKL